MHAESAKGYNVSDASKRDEWDQHNRDEAKERAAQQEAAGPGYKPVPSAPYASLGGSPEARDAAVNVAALVDEYERAAAAERLAWVAARDLVAHDTGSGPWNAWRDAVERTQKAARRLVNRATGQA